MGQFFPFWDFDWTGYSPWHSTAAISFRSDCKLLLNLSRWHKRQLKSENSLVHLKWTVFFSSQSARAQFPSDIATRVAASVYEWYYRFVCHQLRHTMSLCRWGTAKADCLILSVEKQQQQNKSRIRSFFKKLFLIILCVGMFCLHVWLCTVCGLELMEDRRGYQIPWNQSYRWSSPSKSDFFNDTSRKIEVDKVALGGHDPQR